MMKFDFNIPKQLAHLKLDERGYPIPYFVHVTDGKPNFRFQDLEKRDICVQRKLCAICGKKLDKGFAFVITGPHGYKNRTVSDAPMHRVCAEFTLRCCPHLHYRQAERKEQGNDPNQAAEKPDVIFLIKIDKFKLDGAYVHFRPIGFEEYIYESNVLIKKQ